MVVALLSPLSIVAESFTLVGLVDGGRPSGSAIVVGDTLTIVSNDSGAPTRYTIDLSWVRDRLPDLEQDDQVSVEIEVLPGGRLMATQVTRLDSRRGTANQGLSTGSRAVMEQPRPKQEDDAVNTADTQSTPTSTGTPTPTATTTFTPTTTATSTATATFTSTPTGTLTPTATPTNTPTPGTRAYVTNQGIDTVSVIDTAANTVVATIPTGTQLFGVAFRPDGARAYVANALSNTVSVVDTATNTVVATIPVGNAPSGVAVSP